jgi:integrase
MELQMADGKLSALKIKNAKSGKLLDGHGLYLYVRGDSKTWVFRYRRKHLSSTGKPLVREMGLGGYPLFSLAEARERAKAKRQLLADGIDPIEQRQAQKQAEAVEKAKAVTFRECAENYIESHKHGWKNSRHAGQWTSTLATFVYPIIGNLPVAAIDTALVMKVMQQPVDETTFWNARTETASRVRGRIESVLGYAKAQKFRTTGENPAAWADLKHLLPAKTTVAPVEPHKAMAYREVPGFMADLRKDKGLVARALEWTILCAVRSNDTLGATWGEINREAKTWTIPAGRVKGKKGTRRNDHVVPLCDRALKILGGLPEGGASDAIFRINWKPAMLELLTEMRPGEALTIHGFRSTFKDWCSEQTAYPNELSELALAHTVSSAVERAYRRGDMLEKRRRMMGDWSNFCASPPAAKGDNVVAMRAAT